MKLLKFLTHCTTLFASFAYAAEPVVYVVKKGDSLSVIAQSQIGTPIYSKRRGSLYKLIAMNPGINISSIIYPGQALIVGQKSSQLSLSDNAKPIPAIRALGSNSDATPVEPIESATKKTQVDSPQLAEKEKPKALPATQKANETEEIPHKLALSATYGMTTISVSDPNSDTTADLFTSHDAKVSAGWTQEWTPTFSTTLFGSLRDVDFQASTNSAKSLSSTHKTMTGLGISATQKASERFEIHYGLGYESRLFIHGLSTSTVVVDAVPVPEASVGLTYKALEIGKTSLGLKIQGAYLMSASSDGYSVNSGYLYSAGGYVRRKYGTDSVVTLGISYQDRAQSTSILHFHEKSVLGTLTFDLPLFEGGEKK